MSAESDVAALVAAGPIAAIARVGHAPFDIDDPIEIFFQSGALYHIDIGFVGATDIVMREGPLLEHAFGHLRTEEPDTFTAIARDWTSEPIDLAWAIGHTLANPRRLAMTEPYRVEVGYVFDIAGRALALFGEADLIQIGALDDPHIEAYAPEIGAPFQY
ncbi:MAG: hypothetical protein WDM79_01110 [Terricaulis sp.]